MSGCYENDEYNLRRYMKIAGDGDLKNNFNGTGYSLTRVVEAMPGSSEVQRKTALEAYVAAPESMTNLGGGSKTAAEIADDCSVSSVNKLRILFILRVVGASPAH